MPASDLPEIRRYLNSFDFAGLFNYLGWSLPTSTVFTLSVPLDHKSEQQTLSFEPVAQMGGVPVFRVTWPFDTLPRVSQRREVYKALSTRAHEHLLIYSLSNREQLALVWARQGANRSQVELRTLPYDLHTTGRTTLEQLKCLTFAMAELEDETPTVTDVVHKLSQAFDVEAVTQAFFADYKRIFNAVENAIEYPSDQGKRLFVQRLFNRLLFIRFLEKRGWLTFTDRTDYLRSLWEDYQANRQQGDEFYDNRLHPLFFRALAVPHGPNDIGAEEHQRLAALVGNTPYLNGGLFEEEEDDRDNRVVVPDTAFELIVDELLYRFNFTVTESTPLEVEVAVDPEMLGKIFEELITERQGTGSYYTPKTVVSFMCREVLKGYFGDQPAVNRLVDNDDVSLVSVPVARDLLEKIDNLRAVDPACGSGAYLLGLLHELVRITQKLDVRAQYDARAIYDLKLNIIQRNLYGVDIDRFAVNIARLRLWLSLIVDFDGDAPPPLPNLDFKIEVGNSLTAPDPTSLRQVGASEELVRQFNVAKEKYLTAKDPKYKAALQREIDHLRESISQWAHQGIAASGFDWAVEFAEVFGRSEAPGFDTILANPPYGVTVEDGVRNLYFNPRTEKGQSKDSYGIFMARALQLLRPGGQFCYIVSDTWRTIKTHRPLRKRLLAQTTVDYVLDLPPWIFGATVNTCILKLSNTPAAEDSELIAGDLRTIPPGGWDILGANLRAVARKGADAQTHEYARYTFAQSLISTYANCSFFIASPHLYGSMSDNQFGRLGDIADVKQGLITAENRYYLRQRDGVRDSYEAVDESTILTHDTSIDALTNEEKLNGLDPSQHGGRYFLPFDKGGESDTEEGWLPNYYVPTHYFIDWSIDAVRRLRTLTVAELRTRQGRTERIRPGDESRIASRFQNKQFYFRRGVTFSPTGIYSPTFRIGSGTVFGNKGSTIFSDQEEPEVLLGILASTAARYFLKCYLSHTVETGEEVLTQLILPPLDNESRQLLKELVQQIIAKQKANPRYPYYLHEQKAIDELVYQLYGLADEDIREIKLWYCRRYPTLARSQGVLEEVKREYNTYLRWAERQLTVLEEDLDNEILGLIAQGESKSLEFKATARWDVREGRKDDLKMNEIILATVASFLNSYRGGTLLIGVADDGAVVGLDYDYRTIDRPQKRDGYDQFLTQLLARLGPDLNKYINFRVVEASGKDVCRIDIEPAHRPAWVTVKTRHGNEESRFYVRLGALKQPLDGQALTDYVAHRFGTYAREGLRG